ncbi:MAG: flagellar biosynthesis protein FlhF, partial [Brevinema sp.]
IDTAGLSPKENIAIEEIAHWIHKINQKVDIHLVVSATTKASDLEIIYERYSCVNINHILVSKTDETNNLGSILSLAYKYNKPLSFLTDGQEIPQDFKIADTNRLIHDSLC